ncbi:MAG: hypothetical protein ACK4ND_00195 [Cytophagaceae bacterium]
MVRYLMTAILTIFFLSTSFAQKVELKVALHEDEPDKVEMPGTHNLTGFTFSLGYIPFQDFPLILALSGSFGSKAHSGLTVWEEPSGLEYLHLQYRNNLSKWTLGTKFIKHYSYHRLLPYISPQIGFVGLGSRSKLTNTIIESDRVEGQVNFADSESDGYYSTTLQNSLLHRSFVPVYGFELGLEYLLTGHLRKDRLRGSGQWSIFLSYSYFRGFKKMTYLDMDNLSNIPPFDGQDYVTQSYKRILREDYIPIQRRDLVISGVQVGFKFRF